MQRFQMTLISALSLTLMLASCGADQSKVSTNAAPIQSQIEKDLELKSQALGVNVQKSNGVSSQRDTRMTAQSSYSALGDVEVEINPNAGGKGVKIPNSRDVSTMTFQNVGDLKYLSGQVIIKVPQNKVDQLAKKLGAVVLDRGLIPSGPNQNAPMKYTGYVLLQVPDSATALENIGRKEFKGSKAQDALKNALKNHLKASGARGKVTAESEAVISDYLLMKELEKQGYAAELNLTGETQAINPDLPESTGYTARSNEGYNLARSNIFGVWARGYTGKNVKVAVIDTGFVNDDYELSGYDPIKQQYPNGWYFLDQYDFAEGDYDVSADASGDVDGRGTTWHGFGVAQVVAGRNGNQYSTTGVAPESTIIRYRVGRGIGNLLSYYDAGRAVDTAVAWGAGVINMSFSFRSPGAAGVPNTYLGEALARSHAAGVINVAAIGNDNAWVNNNHWPWDMIPIPGGWYTVVGVGAVNNSMEKQTYSNYGPGVTVYAFDTNRVTSKPSEACWSNYRCQASLRQPGGTSIASPFVAGIAALLKQAKPNLTTDQFKTILYNNSMNVNGLRIIEANWALTAAQNLP